MRTHFREFVRSRIFQIMGFSECRCESANQSNPANPKIRQILILTIRRNDGMTG